MADHLGELAATIATAIQPLLQAVHSELDAVRQELAQERDFRAQDEVPGVEAACLEISKFSILQSGIRNAAKCVGG